MMLRSVADWATEAHTYVLVRSNQTWVSVDMHPAIPQTPLNQCLDHDHAKQLPSCNATATHSLMFLEPASVLHKCVDARAQFRSFRKSLHYTVLPTAETSVSALILDC